MKKQRIVFAMAVLSLLIYSCNWVAAWYGYPHPERIKLLALIPFLIGLITYFLLWREKQNEGDKDL